MSGATELYSPKDQELFGRPYGVYHCADGRQVMFDRSYRPMWSKSPDGLVLPANRNEWVKFTRQTWFYCDRLTKRERAIMARAALVAFGAPLG